MGRNKIPQENKKVTITVTISQENFKILKELENSKSNILVELTREIKGITFKDDTINPSAFINWLLTEHFNQVGIS